MKIEKSTRIAVFTLFLGWVAWRIYLIPRILERFIIKVERISNAEEVHCTLKDRRGQESYASTSLSLLTSWGIKEEGERFYIFVVKWLWKCNLILLRIPKRKLTDADHAKIKADLDRLFPDELLARLEERES